jgi:O-antigen/teichoic acid export membrane protein
MLRNILSLYSVQLLSYAIPLLLTPYLARTLGPTMFGVNAIWVSIIAYLSLLSNWGFDLSASQQVAQSFNDPDHLRRIFWDTLVARGLLALGGVVILLLLFVIFPNLRAHWAVGAASSLALLGTVFTVGWFLQGMEKMGAFAIATLIGRLGSVPITFLLVHSPRDAALAAGIQAVAVCASAAASLRSAFRHASLLPARFDLRAAGRQIASGARLFMSTAAISLYTYTNILAVGFISGPAQAGLFDGADRIKRAGQALTGPVSTAAYPRINRLMVEAHEKAHATMAWLLIVQAGIGLLLTAGVFVSARYATAILLGPAFDKATPIIQCLSLNIFLIGVSTVLGVNIMIPLGMKRAFTTIVVSSGLINLILLSVLVRPFGAFGAALAVTLTEFLVTMAMVCYLWPMRSRAGVLLGARTNAS